MRNYCEVNFLNTPLKLSEIIIYAVFGNDMEKDVINENLLMGLQSLGYRITWIRVKLLKFYCVKPAKIKNKAIK